MTELILRFLYGAIVSSSGFLIGSMWRLALREFNALGVQLAMRSVYFWLSFSCASITLGLVLICGRRTIDSFHGIYAAGGGARWLLVVGFLFLLVGLTGFNWAGTLELRRGRRIWWMSIASLIAWAVFVVFYRP